MVDLVPYTYTWLHWNSAWLLVYETQAFIYAIKVKVNAARPVVKLKLPGLIQYLPRFRILEMLVGDSWGPIPYVEQLLGQRKESLCWTLIDIDGFLSDYNSVQVLLTKFPFLVSLQCFGDKGVDWELPFDQVDFAV